MHFQGTKENPILSELAGWRKMSSEATDKGKGQVFGFCDLPNSKVIKENFKVGDQNSPMNKSIIFIVY